MNKIVSLIFLVIYSHYSYSQTEYKIHCDTQRMENWPGVHSFIYGILNDTLIIFGGRIDGLHEKESGFERKKTNDSTYLICIKNRTCKAYKTPFYTIQLHDAMTMANSLFTQKGDDLYFIGGYGENSSASYHTMPSLSKLNLRSYKNALDLNSNKFDYNQIIDSTFAIAGGQMLFLDGKLFVVGGHKFTGKYNDSSSKIIQSYTNKASIYTIAFFNDSFIVQKDKEIYDEFNFHRRDFNLTYNIDQNGETKLMLFSGVFLENENRPFFNLAELNYNGYKDVENFEQRFANYHCGKVGFYNKKNKSFSFYFIGGMSEYYKDSIGNISRDPFIPFVKHISKVHRDSSGVFTETILQDTLPAFLGTNGEFIINPKINRLFQDIIDENELRYDTLELGFILGGILNPTETRNPYASNLANMTISNPYLINIRFIKHKNTNISKTPKNNLTIELIPSSQRNHFEVKLQPLHQEYKYLFYYIYDTQGRLISSHEINDSQSHFFMNLNHLQAGIYNVVFTINKLYKINKQIHVY